MRDRDSPSHSPRADGEPPVNTADWASERLRDRLSATAGETGYSPEEVANRRRCLYEEAK